MLPKIQVSGKSALFSVKDLILGILIASIFWPIYFLIYMINVPTRRLVQFLYDHFHPGKYQIMDGEDSVFGTKIKGNCNSLIQGFQIIKGVPNVDKMREKYTQMLETTNQDFDRFYHIFTHKYGYFCWERDNKFDIRKHIRLLDNWDIRREADERKIMDIVGDYSVLDMPSDKPQWEILVIPKYRVEGQSLYKECDHYAIFTRFNHAYSDAISFLLMLNNYIADKPGELPMDPTKPFKIPLWVEAIVWAKVILLGPLSFITIMITYVFGQSLYGPKYYVDTKLAARSEAIKLDTVKRLKKASGASVTAILYTAVYSALYKSHLRLFENAKVPEYLHLGSVMAMFPYWQKKKLGNQFTLWPYSARLNVEDLNERLRMSNEITLKGMGSPGPVLNFYLSRSLGSLPRLLHHLLWSLSGSPVMLSNVPGFNTRVGLFGGEMVDAAGFIPLMSTVGVGMSTQSYCGDFRFNAIVDPQTFPRRSDLQMFLNDVIHELRKLAAMYGISDHVPESQEVDLNNNNLPEESIYPAGKDISSNSDCDYVNGDDLIKAKNVNNLSQSETWIGKCIQ